MSENTAKWQLVLPKQDQGLWSLLLSKLSLSKRKSGKPSSHHHAKPPQSGFADTVKVVINTGCGFKLSIEAFKRCIAENAIGIDTDWEEVTDPNAEFSIDVGDGFRQNMFTGMLFRDGAVYAFNCSKEASRSDPALVKIVEEMGEAASDEISSLKILEVPSDVSWHIDEDEDGTEYVRENSRVWRFNSGK
jgi:hypothetical protein